MKPENAKTSATSADLSVTSLEYAVSHINKADIFTLVVSSEDFLRAKELVKKLGADTADNPLSPQINLAVDLYYTANEWSVDCNGAAFWSPGA
jgi:hypothetical protein